MPELRLFPLGSPLFPGMTMPLQVFEPRYLQLIEECQEAGEPFGIALIRSGAEVGETAEPYSMGTTAELKLVRPIRGGRLFVEARGRERFRITELHHDRPYLWADVEYPVDELTEVPAALLEDARARLAEVRRLEAAAMMTYDREPDVPATAGPLADAIAADAVGTAGGGELQRIVETLDVRRRLELATELLGDLVERAHARTQNAVAAHWARPDRLN